MVLLLLVSVPGRPTLFSEGVARGASPPPWPLFGTFSGMRKYIPLRDAAAANSQNVRHKATAGRGARAPYVHIFKFVGRITKGRPMAAPTEGRLCNRTRVGTFARRIQGLRFGGGLGARPPLGFLWRGGTPLSLFRAGGMENGGARRAAPPTLCRLPFWGGLQKRAANGRPYGEMFARRGTKRAFAFPPCGVYSKLYNFVYFSVKYSV